MMSYLMPCLAQLFLVFEFEEFHGASRLPPYFRWRHLETTYLTMLIEGTHKATFSYIIISNLNLVDSGILLPFQQFLSWADLPI